MDGHFVNLDVRRWPIPLPSRCPFHSVKHLRAINHLPKHAMLAIQRRVGLVDDEELRAVCVGPAVGHAEHATLGVLQAFHDFVGEFAVGGVVDASTAFARACGVTCKGGREEE